MLGSKRNVPVGEVAFPGIVQSEPYMETAKRRDGSTFERRVVDVISLRTTNPANGPVTTFYKVSPEPLQFLPLRFTEVEGLDDLSAEVLAARHLESILDQNAKQAEARGPRTLAVASGVEFTSTEDEDEVTI